MPPLTYRPYERRTLENLLGAQGLSGGTAYDIFSGVQGTALERLARQQALRLQRRQMATQAQQGFQQGLPGLAQFAVGMSQTPGVSEGVVGSVFGAYPDRFQGPLQDLLASAFPGTGSLADIGPQLDAEDLSGIDLIVSNASPMTAQTGDGTYHRALMSVLTKFRTLGYSPTVTEAARRYFDAMWKNAGGPPPSPEEAPGNSVSSGTGFLGARGPLGRLADVFTPGSYSQG